MKTYSLLMTSFFISFHRSYSFHKYSFMKPFQKKSFHSIRQFSRKKMNDVSGLVGASSSTTKKNTRNIAPQYNPKTPNQELYLNYLNDNDTPIVFGIGPAGCGKTLFACITAIQELMSGNVNKIIITRPIVPVEEEEIGFLPGNLIHKMDPWTRPIFDILLEFYQQKDLDLMLHSGIIEISPLAYMRGRTFKRCFIIADEMQNSTPNQMLMLSTRIGDKTKLVVTGDLKQSDRSQSNGLIDFMNKYKLYNENNEYDNDNKKMIQIVEMKHEDIRRSKVVSKIIDIYDMKPNSWVNNRLNINSEQVIEESVVQENVVGEKSFSKTINNLNITKYHYDNNNDCAIIPLSHML